MPLTILTKAQNVYGWQQWLIAYRAIEAIPERVWTCAINTKDVENRRTTKRQALKRIVNELV